VDDGFTIDKRTVADALRLVAEARSLADDYGPEVRREVDLAAAEPLADDDARRLFSRILVLLRSHGQDLDDLSRQNLAREVRSEVDRLVNARHGGGSMSHGAGLKLVERSGVPPHPVTPVPTFSGQPIAMWEGYVDVRTLDLWAKNHRVDLYVKDFHERNRRYPNPEDLLAILQGRIKLGDSRDRDPFKIKGLAQSIARKGVERPPIVTWSGEPKDGNRRIAAAKQVLEGADFTAEEKERARWVRVWRAPEGTTEDQFEAIVVALNFEEEHKEAWPEYVKARLVVERYRTLRDGLHSVTTADDKRIKEQVAKSFAITPQAVARYIRMLQWADEFETHHIDVRNRDDAGVRYKSNDIFQWFYEIEAGKGQEKLTRQMEGDDALKAVVYDLMFDVLDSGAQVRKLHQVVSNETSLKLLQEAHELSERDDKQNALKMVEEAIAEAQKNSPTKKLGFDLFLKSVVQRLGGAPPDQWRGVEADVLRDVERVLYGALGAIQGELASRGILSQRP
jgi:hypothetical protein